MSSAHRARLSGARLGNGLALLALVVLAGLLFTWQPGPWWPGPPRPTRWIGAGAAVLAWLGLSGGLLWRARARRTPVVPAAQLQQVDPDTVLVAHASQTGLAIELAVRTAQSLREAGLQAQVQSLAWLDAPALARYRRALFVVSTTGEGDPPDLALEFVRTVMAGAGTLDTLHYAVLALGDASYAHYCAFGRQLDRWLRSRGAVPLFERVEVDNAQAAALRHWQHQLSLLAGKAELAHWPAPVYQAWTLRARRLLNPGSVGGPVHHLELIPPAALPHWQAGDLVEILPRHPPQLVQAWLRRTGLDGDTPVLIEQTPVPLAQVLATRQLPDALTGDVHAQALADDLPLLAHRQYSVASVPADGALHLLLRCVQCADGQLGLASGWLCRHAPLGAPIALRLRSNPNFHPPAPSTPLILIGNGTGIAGLRALLKARIAAGARRNWLLFGERQRAHDLHYGQDIGSWQAQGWLERLDLAFSRDDAPPRYVQDALRQAAAPLQAWIADGAAVYVCGSMDGMAPAVEAVLHETLGHALVEQLRMQGHYRRDVY